VSLTLFLKDRFIERRFLVWRGPKRNAFFKQNAIPRLTSRYTWTGKSVTHFAKSAKDAPLLPASELNVRRQDTATGEMNRKSRCGSLIVIVLFAFVSLSCAKRSKEEFSFVGVVKSYGMGYSEYGAAITVQADPRFTIILFVENVGSGKSPWVEGDELVLGIHSATLLFGPADITGRRFEFSFMKLAPDSAYCEYCLVRATEVTK